MDSPLAIILAAGRSTRFKTARPKVLHEVCGRPMVSYVIQAARQAGAARILLVVGHEHERVREGLADEGDLEFVLQAEQLGTGHAVGVCRDTVGEHQGPVLVLCGDNPLVRGESLKALVRRQQADDVALVLGTAVLDDPTGYGRIVRDPAGNICRIVEQKDATAEEQRTLTEVNPSTYVFDRAALFESLDQVRPDNAQQEYYLTDCVAILLGRGRRVEADACLRPEEAVGVNDRAQLAAITALKQQEILGHWMAEGVTIVDPRSTCVDSRAVIGPDTTILPFTTIQGPVTIGARCRYRSSVFRRTYAEADTNRNIG